MIGTIVARRDAAKHGAHVAGRIGGRHAFGARARRRRGRRWLDRGKHTSAYHRDFSAAGGVVPQTPLITRRSAAASVFAENARQRQCQPAQPGGGVMLVSWANLSDPREGGAIIVALGARQALGGAESEKDRGRDQEHRQAAGVERGGV